MDYKKLVSGVLVIFLLVGAAVSVTAAALGTVPMFVQVMPDWVQVNSNGFGDVQAREVSAVESFNGYLYAGTHNPVNDARIFRSPDGVTWTAVIDPGFGSAHDTAPRAILDMAVFKGYLYASTGRGNASQIWRTSSGLFWGQVVTAGFGDPDTVEFTAMTVYDHGYDQAIYVGATNQVNGAQIWRSFSGDSNSWTQVAPAVAGTAISNVTGFSTFDGALYAAVSFESDTPAQIWRSYGGDWTTIVDDGFGNSNTTMTGGMAVFGGYLYVGAGNTASGAQLWRTNNGTTWTQAITPAFGDANNVSVEMVSVFQNQLYVSVKNSATGIEIWRSADGSVWEQVNVDGFGDANNTGSNMSNATAVFLSHLHVGTANVAAGGELWQQQAPYGIALSPDDALSGLAGQSVTYTVQITNTGSLTDTFDLALSGNSWVTAVSTPSITLNPGISNTISVTVSIPSSALGGDSDMATITATSQGNPTKSDSAHLNTSVLPVYSLDLSPGYALSGLPGATVTYTLTISNSGNAADTFDLAAIVKSWVTAVSTPNITLNPGVSDTISVTVSIPSGTLGGDSDMVTIMATSQGDSTKSDSAQLATSVLPVYGLEFSPGYALSGPPGETVTYTLTISNSGNVTDTYALTIADNSWTTVPSTASMVLAPGDSGAFTTAVTIPTNALNNAADTVTITATSQGNNEVKENAVLTTNCLGLIPMAYLPMIVRMP